MSAQLVLEPQRALSLTDAETKCVTSSVLLGKDDKEGLAPQRHRGNEVAASRRASERLG